MKINHILFTETKWTRRGALLFGLAMMLCVLLLGLQGAKPAQAAGTTFTVNSTNDPGTGGCDATECTLREAITAANATSAADTIKFNIPSIDPSRDPNCDATAHVCTISPTTQFPAITHPVTIDGYTQGRATTDTADDATVNTLPEPGKTNAVLKIQLVGGFGGLILNAGASHSVIRGLVINVCVTCSICATCSGILFSAGGTGYKVEGNFLGIAADGITKQGNEWGVLFENTSGSTIGGTTPDKRNLISGNSGEGVVVEGSSSGNMIEGNIIGPDKDGNPLGNSRNGVVLDSSAGTGNRILSNSIFSNGKLGIDLVGGTEGTNGVTANDPKDPDTGANRLQNYPVITSAQFINNPSPIPDSTSIHGTLDSTPSTRHKKRTFIIQFFKSPDKDSSGYGEGKTFLDQTEVRTDRQGQATFDFGTQAVPVGEYITATATNKATGDTSEFSNAEQVKDIGL